MIARVLLVEDRLNLRNMLETSLSGSFVVDGVGDVAGAVARLRGGRYDVVVTDVRLPDGTGLEVLAAARQPPHPPEVVIMTAYGGVPEAVGALKAGAYDYLLKPFEPEVLTRVVARAAERHQLLLRTRELENAVASGEGELVGQSAPMRAVRRLVEKVATLPVPVMLRGEAGTGKEEVARELHRLRGDAPFVAMNCGSAPDAVLEAELFGVGRDPERGDRPGLIELAEKGTLFLDEIGELPLGLQIRLNRLLEDGEYRRLGDAAPRRASFRLIVATDRDLDAGVATGQFRADLLFRLKVMTISLPPLRERREDIALLAARFLRLSAARLGTRAWRLAPDALATLEAAQWPGNVAELRHAVEHAAVIADDDTVEVEHLPEAVRQSGPPAPTGTYRAACERAAEDAGRDYLIRLLTQLRGNVTRAALEAGMERESLHRLMRKHRIDPSRFRA